MDANFIFRASEVIAGILKDNSHPVISKEYIIEQLNQQHSIFWQGTPFNQDMNEEIEEGFNELKSMKLITVDHNGFVLKIHKLLF